MQDIYNVGIYCRLSRDDERVGESLSIENQKELLARYVQEQGWNFIDYYVDDGVSGTTFDRPGFTRLLLDAKNGKINCILCKDLSRLGRDYIEAGKYTSIIFPSLGCRFIALNDGVDTAHKNDDMTMIFKNVMNDLYARDTSDKIKLIKLSTFKAGKYVGCYAPIGYVKSPEDKHVLVIDPETAPLVQRIFDMRCQGMSFRHIAVLLNEEKVPTPSGFYYAKQSKPNARKDGDFWQWATVRAILRNEVYLGHMVQNKTGNVSYKVHKEIQKPKSEWIRVENTHEPIISQEVWDMAQAVGAKQMRMRTSNSGETALFNGILFCADCGSPMRRYKSGYRRKDGSKSVYQAYACQRYSSGGKAACTGHIMNQRVLIELVLADVRSKALIAQRSPARLMEAIQSQKQAANSAQMKQMQSELKTVDKRLTELEKFTQSIYEDRVMGKVPENVCIRLLNQYEDERKSKTERRAALAAELETFEQSSSDVKEWVHLIRDYTKLEELDRPTLLRLINRIEVGEKHTVDGHVERDIRIFYNFVGYIDA